MADQQQNNNVYLFAVGWLILIFILTLVNKSRLGHVVLYYSLMLMILVIVASEYQNITPLLGGIETISQLNAKNTAQGTSIQGAL